MNSEKVETVVSERSMSPKADRKHIPKVERSQSTSRTHEQLSDQAGQTKRTTDKEPKNVITARSTNETFPRKKRAHIVGHDVSGPEEVRSDLKVECLDITDSKWVQDPDDPTRETVFLTSERSSLQEAQTIETSFCWIHYQRDTSSITFDEFEKVLDGTPSLYTHEAAVASKCLKEAKLARKTFARGKYFGHIVHQASDVLGSAMDKVPVKATFLSLPIFALLNSDEVNETSSQPASDSRQYRLRSLLRFLNSEKDEKDRKVTHLSSRALRDSNQHPIRSLLQYSNIVAADHARDRRQVITGMDGEDASEVRPFIHVPELWALTVNMYTIITCAPFSVEDLCAENVELRRPSPKDRRVLVKYTNLTGTLHDFRCRTWFGLLDTVSGIEFRIDDLKTLLNDPASEYKIIDPDFHIIDRDRWSKLAEPEPESKGPRIVNARLIKSPNDSNLSHAFAERKLQAHIRATWTLLKHTVVLGSLEERLSKLRKARASQKELGIVKNRIQDVSASCREITRTRLFHRLVLCAVRFHLLDPYNHSPHHRGIERGALRAATVAGDGFHGDGQVEDGRSTQGVRGQPIVHHSSTAERKQAISQPKARLPGKEVARVVTGNVPLITVDSASTPVITEPDSVPIPVPSKGDKAGTTAALKLLDRGNLDVTDKNMLKEIEKIVISPIKRSSTGLAEQSIESSRKPTRAKTYNDSLEGRQSPRPNPDLFESPRPKPHSQSHNHETATIGTSTSAIRQASAPGSKRDGFPSDRHATPSFSRRSPAALRRNEPAIQVFPVSPQRLPLRSEGSGSATLISAKATAKAAARAEKMAEHDSRPTESTKEALKGAARVDSRLDSTITDPTKRAGASTKGLVPFFDWRTKPTHPPETDPARQALRANSQPAPNDQQSGDNKHHTIFESATDILKIIDEYIKADRHFDPATFPIKCEEYNKIEGRYQCDVLDLLENEQAKSIEVDLDDRQEAARQFLDCKNRLVLRIQGLLRSFVCGDKHDDMVIRKLWGIVYRICAIPLEPEKPHSMTFKHETSVVQYAAKEVEKFEQKCKELLMDVRSESADDETSFEFQLPITLISSFRHIVLFLLSVLLAVSKNGIGIETINVGRDRVSDYLRESESALLRMTEHAESDLDQIGDESIRAADTLLGLILENALLMSCREADAATEDSGRVHCDLEYVYSRYTDHCIEQAKEEASAHHYEGVRLLKEEIDTIIMVFKDQRSLFAEVVDKRESPIQNLDIRLNRRIKSHLEEMIKHFETLSEYAKQAEFWTKNSIEVHGERNTKAIYVFTAVTVIFLPLSFVSGVLGMNTADVRTMEQGQWLFWIIAIPTTLLVLVICVCIVYFKFRLRRSFGTMFLWPIIWLCGRRIGTAGMQEKVGEV